MGCSRVSTSITSTLFCRDVFNTSPSKVLYDFLAYKTFCTSFGISFFLYLEQNSLGVSKVSLALLKKINYLVSTYSTNYIFQFASHHLERPKNSNSLLQTVIMAYILGSIAFGSVRVPPNMILQNSYTVILISCQNCGRFAINCLVFSSSIPNYISLKLFEFKSTEKFAKNAAVYPSNNLSINNALIFKIGSLKFNFGIFSVWPNSNYSGK